MADETSSPDNGKMEYVFGPQIVFNVDSKYEVLQPLGKGAYGTVGKGRNKETGALVAIKRINPVFHHPLDAKRILRELKLLRQLKHENVVRLVDIMVIPKAEAETYDEIYVVTDAMDTDLDTLIRKTPLQLQEVHFKFFMYQLLKGLKYIHSANIIHRDLKPQNILVNADSKLEICDFGLSRVSDTPDGILNPTEYVVSRWYRAPEVICDRTAYGFPIDIWSAGCVFAELLNKKPLLPGRDQVQQLAVILEFLGTPSPDEIAHIKNRNAQKYVLAYRKTVKKDLHVAFPHASAEARDMLDKMLQWNPGKRWTAAQLLEHPFVAEFRTPGVAGEPTAPEPLSSFDFEGRKLEIPLLRELIYNEMLHFHPELGSATTNSAFAPDLALSADELAQLVDLAASSDSEVESDHEHAGHAAARDTLEDSGAGAPTVKAESVHTSAPFAGAGAATTTATTTTTTTTRVTTTTTGAGAGANLEVIGGAATGSTATGGGSALTLSAGKLRSRWAKLGDSMGDLTISPMVEGNTTSTQPQ